jgi:hypothetical protein
VVRLAEPDLGGFQPRIRRCRGPEIGDAQPAGGGQGDEDPGAPQAQLLRDQISFLRDGDAFRVMACRRITSMNATGVPLSGSRRQTSLIHELQRLPGAATPFVGACGGQGWRTKKSHGRLDGPAMAKVLAVPSGADGRSRQ